MSKVLCQLWDQQRLQGNYAKHEAIPKGQKKKQKIKTKNKNKNKTKKPKKKKKKKKLIALMSM